MYAGMIFCLWRHSNWQKECGISLALERDKQNKGKNKDLERCCSACELQKLQGDDVRGLEVVRRIVYHDRD